MELDLNGIHQLAKEQGIDEATVDEALSEALRLAYLKNPHAAKHARVELDPRAGTLTVWARDEIAREATEDNPHPGFDLGDEYDDTPKDFGRQAADTARQVISQLFRKAEDDRIFGAFSGQRGKLITGVVQQDAKDKSNVHVAVGDVEALLPVREQVPGERYQHGQRIRVYVVNVSRGLKGPEIIVSRSHPELVRKLFEREVPELTSGAVSIMAIAREAGGRTKIAVRANVPGVNPKGALIGPGGSRVRAVMENLGHEKIDIVDWSNDPAKFIAAALSPAVVSGVNVVSEKNQTAVAFIDQDQLSLAIGKAGQNARLAAKLTGWKIGVESEQAHAAKLAQLAAERAAAQGSDAASDGADAQD
ncbi:MAG: transcription termination factor NusA [Bifidobacterium sp.]|nr:transcription termination factor NusA [Bifidobacterium sp.]